ncbi:GLE1-domain-containing protein [Teratosphaeria nubilosa]|uniref:GLE1-domain-containing protein n=1 Tax=Teratosphaeria nubilosa TaxID=161662 RepID=A0A6G1L5W4_9PEZI|nr:GLE1-domain-containing protein [Teratosphaeria nubilosa]
MSSPLHSADSNGRHTASVSPARARRADSGHGRVNGFHSSPSRSLQQPNDSPSRQLWDEMSKLYLNEEKTFRDVLNAQTAEQERLHKEALREALERHEAVRESAERARAQLELEIRIERQKRAEREKAELAKKERELAEAKAAAEHRELEEAKRQEQERKQRQALQRVKEEQARRAEAQKQQEAKDKAEREAARQKGEADRKAREDAKAREDTAARERERQAAAKPPAQPAAAITHGAGSHASAPASSVTQQAGDALAQAVNQGLVSNLQKREQEHEQYLQIHSKLKALRNRVQQILAQMTKDANAAHQAKINARQAPERSRAEMPPAKQKMDYWKQEIRKKIGQLNKVDKNENKQKLAEVRAILSQAKSDELMTQCQRVDITEYIIGVHSRQPVPATSDAEKQYPELMLYLLNLTAKLLLKQLYQDTGEDTKIADAIGVFACTIFSVPEFRWQGVSLIDIVWAKYHVLAPALFGLNPPPTAAGRRLIGWKADMDATEFYRAQWAYGAGFSALTLRDFSRSKNPNPAPNRIWWESMSRILNVPAGQAQHAHYWLVKGMIEDWVPRIIGIFGGAGKAILKTCVRELPKKGPRDANKQVKMEGPVLALQSLDTNLQKQWNITL